MQQGKESQASTATTPADLATPTIDSITGNSGKGYEITGNGGATPKPLLRCVTQTEPSLLLPLLTNRPIYGDSKLA